MKKLTIFILCMMAALTSCKGDENGYTEEKLDFKHPAEDLSGVFDYESLLGMEHPRLFLNMEDWENIKAARSTDPNVEEVCYIIGTYADSYVNLADLTYTFDEVGKRILAISSAALSRISFSAAAYRLTGEEKYLARVERDLQTVCNFPNWNPSHFLDVGEMSLAVAIGYDWCYNELSEETKELCRKTISSHAFYASDCGNRQYINAKGNWNQVCNCGITTAALAFFEDQPTRYKGFIEKAVKSVKIAMGQYAPDGSYDEGYGYWEYGTGFNIMILTAFDKIFGHDAGLSTAEGFDKTGEYILFMGAPAGGFNYSDNGTALFNVLEEFYFAKRFDKPSLLYREKQLLDLKRYRSTSRVFPMLVLPFIMDAKLDGEMEKPGNFYYGRGRNPVVMVRSSWYYDSRDKFVGIKAGLANISHSHMDVGSFVYDSKGYRWAIDPGREAYASVEAHVSDFWKYNQTSGRWTKVMRMRPEHHNTLTIKGQLHNVDASIDFDETFDTDAERGGSFDMASVLSNGVETAKRSVKLINNEYLEVKDHIAVSSNLTIRWNLMPPGKATLVGDNCLRLDYANQSVYLNIESDKPIKIFNEILTNQNSWDTMAGMTHVGFDCDLKAGETADFRVTITDTQPQ